MRILLTGASSFTGTWFVRELAAAGHEVVVTLRGGIDAYEGVRRRRVADVCERAAATRVCRFGDEAFLALVAEGFDLLCHHGAEVTDYKSSDFDPLHALQHNVAGLRAVLERLEGAGGRHVLLTGSVFESGEGVGDGDAFSRYGLSKALTSQVFRYECRAAGIGLGKFVIPNPFGPLEEPRFTTYLAGEWARGRTPRVATPHYVRDNVHVTLLARAYVRFAEQLVEQRSGFARCAPSGYRESQGAFASRFAAELAPRLGCSCPLELADSHPFDEPRMRVNTDEVDVAALGWDEEAAWDELADWYRTSVPSLCERVSHGA